jgi:hypothetical protein
MRLRHERVVEIRRGRLATDVCCSDNSRRRGHDVLPRAADAQPQMARCGDGTRHVNERRHTGVLRARLFRSDRNDELNEPAVEKPCDRINARR